MTSFPFLLGEKSDNKNLFYESTDRFQCHAILEASALFMAFTENPATSSEREHVERALLEVRQESTRIVPACRPPDLLVDPR